MQNYRFVSQHTLSALTAAALAVVVVSGVAVAASSLSVVPRAEVLEDDLPQLGRTIFASSDGDVVAAQIGEYPGP